MEEPLEQVNPTLAVIESVNGVPQAAFGMWNGERTKEPLNAMMKSHSNKRCLVDHSLHVRGIISAESTTPRRSRQHDARLPRDPLPTGGSWC